MRRIDWTAARPGRYPPDGRSPDEAMAAIRHAAVEIGYGYDADRRLRFIQVGDETGIRGFDQADLIVIADGLFVHNHPPYPFPAGDPRRLAGSFSATDLVFMYEYDLAEIVAVTRERRYRLQRPAGGFFLDAGQIAAEYRKVLFDVREDLEIARGLGLATLPETRSEGMWADRVMERMAMFYDYHWTEDET